jgi:pilus assembly protein CpaF
MSFEVIVPFLRPIAHLIENPDVTEIMVNASRRVFVERDGSLEVVEGVEIDERSLIVAVRNIARAVGDDISEARPILDARLPDGTRVAAVIPPCSIGGTTLTIRKFQRRWFAPAELVRVGSLAPQALDIVREEVRRNGNILISGGTGTGKTTFLSALVSYVPASNRVVVIEDTVELQLDLQNIVRLEARRELPDLPAVSIRDLVRATLRHRPDRIIVGEIRGGEAFDLLQALNTGHAGSLSTIHANSPEDAMTRLAACVMQSGVEVPYAAVRRQLATAISLVLHLERRHGKRVLTALLKVDGYDSSTDQYQTRRSEF